MTQTTNPDARARIDSIESTESLTTIVSELLCDTPVALLPQGTRYELPSSAKGRAPVPLYLSADTSSRDIEYIMADLYRSRTD